jgi:hypothetical protein
MLMTVSVFHIGYGTLVIWRWLSRKGGSRADYGEEVFQLHRTQTTGNRFIETCLMLKSTETIRSRRGKVSHGLDFKIA